MTIEEIGTTDERGEPASDEKASVTFGRVDMVPDLCVLEIRGDLDLSVSRTLGDQLTELLALGRDFVAVDLSGVLFMDSSALGALVQAHERAKLRGQQFNLLRPSAACAKVLGITGLDRVFDLI